MGGKLPQSVPGAVVTAAVAGLALVAVKLLNERLRAHLPLPLPGELLTVRDGDGEGGRPATPCGHPRRKPRRVVLGGGTPWAAGSLGMAAPPRSPVPAP